MNPRKFKFRWKGWPVPSDRSLRILRTIRDHEPGHHEFEAALEEARDPDDPFLQSMLWALMADCYMVAPRSRALVHAIARAVLEQCPAVLEGKCYGVQTYGDHDRMVIRPAEEPPDMDHWFDPLP